jgi:hypothetical protein
MNDLPVATGPIIQQFQITAPNEVNINFGGLSVPYVLKSRFEAVIQENIALKAKEESFEQAVKDANARILELIQRYEISEKTIQELQKENEMLKKELNHRRNKELVKLYSIAIIDLAKGDNLMTKVSQDLVIPLNDLNDGRIDDCHYINCNDSKDLKNYKKAFLYKKLKEMSPDVIDLFDQVYDKRLIGEFIVYLEQYPPPVANVDTRTQNRIKLFWD